MNRHDGDGSSHTNEAARAAGVVDVSAELKCTELCDTRAGSVVGTRTSSSSAAPHRGGACLEGRTRRFLACRYA